jgi:hypothetical protein
MAGLFRLHTIARRKADRTSSIISPPFLASFSGARVSIYLLLTPPRKTALLPIFGTLWQHDPLIA